MDWLDMLRRIPAWQVVAVQVLVWRGKSWSVVLATTHLEQRCSCLGRVCYGMAVRGTSSARGHVLATWHLIERMAD